jgi:hypothetical protein
VDRARIGRGAIVGYAALCGAWTGFWVGVGYVVVTVSVFEGAWPPRAWWLLAAWTGAPPVYGAVAGALVSARTTLDALAPSPARVRTPVRTAIRDHVAVAGAGGWIVLALACTRGSAFFGVEQAELGCFAAALGAPFLRPSLRDALGRRIPRVLWNLLTLALACFVVLGLPLFLSAVAALVLACVQHPV